jgi:hypothetical protein
MSDHNCSANCYLAQMFKQLQEDKQKLKKQKKEIEDPNLVNGKFKQFTLLFDN